MNPEHLFDDRMRFHRKCGDRVTLLNDNTTAVRNVIEYNHGLVMSANPLLDDVAFEVDIDRQVNVWDGGLEIGVTTLDPEHIELPATANKLRNTAWILSGNTILKDGNVIVRSYGLDTSGVPQVGDRLGVMRTSKAELIFFLNGRCLGVAAIDVPSRLFAVIDLYGQCVQVTITNPEIVRPVLEPNPEVTSDDPNNDDSHAVSGVEINTIANRIYHKITRDYRNNIAAETACTLANADCLRFHPRCGILVQLTANNKVAERARPLDDYNNGVVMTHRPLLDCELFEIKIEQLVDKWSGSIEVGVTTHNPDTIRFPPTMTIMDTGTIMMSGCKVLINGYGTHNEYGTFNLDELREGDTVGIMRKNTGELHYFINGFDMGVACAKVEPQIWGVVDLYGMTVKVSIVDPSDGSQPVNAVAPIMPQWEPFPQPLPMHGRAPQRLDGETLLFHSLRDSNVTLLNHGSTAHRPNAFELYNNGIVMTNRTLRANELFQVRLDLVITKWAGSIEIGVTQLSCNEIKLPFKLSNPHSATWAMSGEDVTWDGLVLVPQYVRNLSRLREGDTVGVMRKDTGTVHFFLNGVDLGPAAYEVPDHVFGIIDLYGRAAQATIVDSYVAPNASSPESPLSTDSNGTVYPDLCFHRFHGRNARLTRNRLAASRATVNAEFNDAVLFSSRPLRECEMFEIRIDHMIDCWIGNLEIGVTSIRPEQLEMQESVTIAGTATDLTWDTYILSGSAVIKDGECVRSWYPLDLDTLTVGSRVGLMWHPDRSLHFYLDGMDQGKAWYVPHVNIYAVVDLYGQCTKVTIMENEERQFDFNGPTTSENSLLSNPRSYLSPSKYCFAEYCGSNAITLNDRSQAKRVNVNDPNGALVFSSTILPPGLMFEIMVLETDHRFAGSLKFGVTSLNILNFHVWRFLPASINKLPLFNAYLAGDGIRYSTGYGPEQTAPSSLSTIDNLQPGDRIGLRRCWHDPSRIDIFFNSEQLETHFSNIPDKVFVVMELYGSTTKIQAISRPLYASLLQPSAPTDEYEVYCEECPRIPPPPFFGEPTNQTHGTPFNRPPYTGLTLRTATANVNANAMHLASSGVYANEIGTFASASNVHATSDATCATATEMCATPNGTYTTSRTVYATPTGSITIASGSYVPACGADEPTVGEDSAVSEDMPTSPGVDTAHPEPRTQRHSVPYTFHNVHGNNIILCSSDTVATRCRGYDHGVAFVNQPLRRGDSFRFRVDKISNHWSGTVAIGAAASLPMKSVPSCAIDLPYEQNAWILSSELICNNQHFQPTQIAAELANVKVNSVLTVSFRFSGALIVEMDGSLLTAVGLVPTNFSHLYPVIDLYGKVYQASIIFHPYIAGCGASLDFPKRIRDFMYLDDEKLSHFARSIKRRRALSQGNVSKQSQYPAEQTQRFSPIKLRYTTYPANTRPKSLHQSFLLEKPRRSYSLEEKEFTNQEILKSHSTHNFYLPSEESRSILVMPVQEVRPKVIIVMPDDEDDDDDDDDEVEEELEIAGMVEPPAQGEPLEQVESVGDDEIGEASGSIRFFDTNIQQNHQFPEANDDIDTDDDGVDNVDTNRINPPTLDSVVNLLEFTDDDVGNVIRNVIGTNLGIVPMVSNEAVYIRYLYDNLYMGSVEFQGSESDAPEDGCEHMHLVFKFFNHLFSSDQELKGKLLRWGKMQCFCSICTPEADPKFAGWVRLERRCWSGCEIREHGFWTVDQAWLGHTRHIGEVPAPPPRPGPTTATPQHAPETSDIWLDEEGKPHHTVTAIEIDPGSEQSSDTLAGILFYVQSLTTFNRTF